MQRKKRKRNNSEATTAHPRKISDFFGWTSNAAQDCYGRSCKGERDDRGRPHGQATVTYTDGSSYCGSWIHGKRSGLGSLKATDGTLIYNGCWKDDVYEGSGSLYTEGAHYTGTFVAGKQDGHGEQFFEDKSGNLYGGYSGKWKRGCYHGYGQLWIRNSCWKRGCWTNGHFWKGQSLHRNGPGQQWQLEIVDRGATTKQLPQGQNRRSNRSRKKERMLSATSRFPAAKVVSYDGNVFRSQLEARWAVFFEALNLAYFYEPCSFQMELLPYESGIQKLKRPIRYTPDFHIPELKLWIEIKGGSITEQEMMKARMLSYHTWQQVFIIRGNLGTPFKNKTREGASATVYAWDADSESLIEEDGYGFAECACCGRISVVFRADPQRIPCNCAKKSFNYNSSTKISPLDEAYRKANEYIFEEIL